MGAEAVQERMREKSARKSIEVELQHGYSLSPVEAQILASRVEQLIDDRLGRSRQEGQITYQAIAADESGGKPLKECRKVPVHLTLIAEGDSQTWAEEGTEALRRVRVHRMVYEALMQGGLLSQEDLACVLGVGTRTIKRDFSYFRNQGHSLPSRGEVRDMGRGVSHKVAVIRKYVQDLNLTRISRQLGNHGIGSMTRYLRNFAAVMALEDRGLAPAQMQSIVNMSVKLIEQYRELYKELNVPEYRRTLERLRQQVLPVCTGNVEAMPVNEASMAGKGPKKGAT